MANALQKFGSYGQFGGWGWGYGDDMTADVQAAIAKSTLATQQGLMQAAVATQALAQNSEPVALPAPPGGTATPTTPAASKPVIVPPEGGVGLPWGKIAMAVGLGTGAWYAMGKKGAKRNPGVLAAMTKAQRDSLGTFAGLGMLGLGTALLLSGTPGYAGPQIIEPTTTVMGGAISLTGAAMMTSGYKTLTGEKLDLPILRSIPALPLKNPRPKKRKKARRSRKRR